MGILSKFGDIFEVIIFFNSTQKFCQNLEVLLSVKTLANIPKRGCQLDFVATPWIL